MRGAGGIGVGVGGFMRQDQGGSDEMGQQSQIVLDGGLFSFKGQRVGR